MGKASRMIHLRVNPGFGVFWFIPPLLAEAYLHPTSFIERIFFGLSRVGVVLFQTGRLALGWPLGGARVWKLSRTYPDEKSPPFSLPTQGCCFVMSKPTRYLLTISTIPVMMKPFMKVWWPVQLHLLESYGEIFLKNRNY